MIINLLSEEPPPLLPERYSQSEKLQFNPIIQTKPHE
jgi:hypothetical protein